MAARSRTGPPTNYRLIRELGYGTFGTVSLCCDKDTGEELAVKTMMVRSGGDITNKQMLALEKEIRFLTSCHHERIVQYYGCVNSPTHGFMIFLEYMTGGSVTDQIKRDGPLTESLTLRYTQQVLEGLAYLHSKDVIHRDVKGGNVLRDTNGNVKLADFGLAKQVNEITGSMGMSVVGTLRYMAPEVFKGRYDFKIDIWSVGCIVVEMLTGKPPNEGLRDFTDFLSNTQARYRLPSSTTEKTRAMLDRTFRPSAEERPSARELLKQFFENTVPGHGSSIETRAPTEFKFPEKECRLILLGKTGNGKSRTGNTLLGQEIFKVLPFSMASVTSETAHAIRTDKVFGVHLKIIDTPGLFDTSMSQDETMSEICKCAELSLPGPHAVLFVVRLGSRFTEEEERALSMLSEQFGKNIINFVIVVFTHGDILGRGVSVKDIIGQSPDSLKKLLEAVKNRYVVFNNSELMGSHESMDQVKKLLIAVRDMLMDTGETHFSSDFFVSTDNRLQKVRKIMADYLGLGVDSNKIRELTKLCFLEVEKDQKVIEQKLETALKDKDKFAKQRSKFQHRLNVQRESEHVANVGLRQLRTKLEEYEKSKGKSKEIDRLKTKIHKKEEKNKKFQEEIKDLEESIERLGMKDPEEVMSKFLKEIASEMKAVHNDTKEEFRQENARKKLAAFFSDDKKKCCIQ